MGTNRKSVETPATLTDGLSYPAMLKHSHRKNSGKRKGERTRDRLKLATATVLSRVGYQRLRISDICDEAGVSAGSFYVYYQNKDEIAVEVLTEFLGAIEAAYQSDAPPRDAFEAIFRTNLAYIAAARANGGLFRCLLQVADEEPAFAAAANEINRNHMHRVASSILSHTSEGAVTEEVAMLAAYTLGGMVDEICRRIFVVQDAHLKDTLQKSSMTDEALAEFLSVVWYRSLYSRDPDNIRFGPAKGLKAFSASATESKTKLPQK
jgi:AcrR family transcriptional regulator